MAGVVGRPAQREEIEAVMFVSLGVLLDGEREVMDSRRATRKVLGSGGETLVIQNGQAPTRKLESGQCGCLFLALAMKCAA
jgi:hypothetical protein